MWKLRMHLDYVLGPPIGVALFLVMGWLWGRAVRRGRPLTPPMRGALRYGALFMLGVLYFILWQDQLGALFHWHHTWIGLIVAWGIAVALTARWRRRQGRERPEAARQSR